MLNTLLANAVDKTRAVSIGEATLLALLGYLVVFLGIAFLIFIVWLVGKAMVKTSVKTENVREKICASGYAIHLAAELRKGIEYELGLSKLAYRRMRPFIDQIKAKLQEDSKSIYKV